MELLIVDSSFPILQLRLAEYWEVCANLQLILLYCYLTLPNGFRFLPAAPNTMDSPIICLLENAFSHRILSYQLTEACEVIGERAR